MINWQQMINKLEVDMFAAMKILIVCEENAIVAQVAPYEIHQDCDETIHSFDARIIDPMFKYCCSISTEGY